MQYLIPYIAGNTIEIKIHKELQRQKLLLSSLMVSIDFVNHLKPTLVEFLKCVFKNILVK